MSKKFMRRIIFLLAAIFMISCGSLVYADTVDSGTCGENVTWTLDSDGVLTFSGEGEMENYSGGEAPWYSHCRKVKKIIINDGVTSIGDYAFYEGHAGYETQDYNSLESISIPNSVTSIGRSAFQGCPLENITIPYGVTTIGESAFRRCNTRSITLPDSVTTIGEHAFASINALTITIPRSVISIGEFYTDEDFNHETYTMPLILCYKDSVAATIIKNGNMYYAYLDGTKEENTLSGTRGNYLSWEINKLNQTLTITTTGNMPSFALNYAPWDGYEAFISSVEILGSTTNIGEGAFCNCIKLKTCKLPESITTIGDSAFEGCDQLIEINIPNVTTIGDSAFEGCNRLMEINMPKVNTINSYAFEYCTRLVKVSMPQNVKTFEYNVFSDCYSLRELNLPNCESIDLGCELRLDSLVVPFGVQYLDVEYVRNVYVYNPKMDMSEIKLYSDGNIYGYIGSTAEAYATKHGFNFIDITTMEHNHSYGDVITKEATCTKGGSSYSICSVCGHEDINDKSPAKGHKEITIAGKAATCTTAGKTAGKKCTVCGIVTVKQEDIPAKGHKYGSWKTVTSATCTTTGKQQRTCSVCKHADSKAITKLGHNYSTAWTVDKAASTSASGSKSHHCKRCAVKKDVTTIAKIKSIKLSKTTYVYNGSAKSPAVEIKDTNGKTISSKNYTVTKAKGRTNVGKYSYKIVFKNEYKGTKTLYFKINPKATTIKTPVAAKKAFTVKWSKVSKQATGYEIVYATNSKFTTGKKTVKVTTYKATSKKISKLKAKKTYYVKVRTYKIVDGVKYYSTWSDVKKVKTK